MNKRIELLCFSDSSLDRSLFSKVFMHPPLLSEIIKYLNLASITKLSQALRYCQWTSHLSRTILYGYGAGKIKPPLDTTREDVTKMIEAYIESKSVEVKINDVSGLGLENPFTGNFQVAKVVVFSSLRPSCIGELSGYGHKKIIGTLQNKIKFFYSAYYPPNYKQNETIIGRLYFSKKWKDILTYDRFELTELYDQIWVSLSPQLRDHLQPRPAYMQGYDGYDVDEIVRQLVRAFYGRNQPDNQE